MEPETDGRGNDGNHSPGLTAIMLDLSRVQNYYVACWYMDLRREIGGLAAIVTQQFGQELSEESLFLFCGRRTDSIKALYFSGDGYIIILVSSVIPVRA